MIREQVNSPQDARTAASGVRLERNISELEKDAGAEAPELHRATSEMQFLVDLGEDWPGWSWARRAVKRTLDVALSLLALIALLPILTIIALAIRLESPGPVFYRQRRCGRHGRSFEMLKFRSMVPEADQMLVDLRDRNESDGLLFKIKQDPRITKVGAIIRRYSVDELPQLVNVLKGEMSLVGPRPLPLESDSFGPIDGQRHAVRPGLTCHWQVCGRSELSYGQMVEMDLGYIRDSSVWTDLRLIVVTVPAVLAGGGAY
ncbi:MAG TPA: sugar transferase [Acidimicrobiales bacterium]|nr:sugar transferase [Acidimicrobiales bacterium]